MKNQGFVLLFAVLTSSILLSVGLALSNVSYKEIILSAAGRDSQFAFFGADTGSECAFYWDRKWLDHDLASSPFPENNLPEGSPFNPGGTDPVSPWNRVKCNNRIITDTDVTSWSVVANATTATTTFTLHLGFDDTNNRDGCVTVEVVKNLPAGHVLPDVKIISVGASSCSATDPRVVERTIESSIPGF